ncbi:MAG: hypothetical protein FVQ81_17405 [Candidatus Glassbacteria bacterium]|nr:hypothetical protein [Candidatus Glassbacteria bacterium]
MVYDRDAIAAVSTVLTHPAPISQSPWNPIEGTPIRCRIRARRGIATYRAGLGPESCWDVLCATIVSNWGGEAIWGIPVDLMAFPIYNAIHYIKPGWNETDEATKW